MTQRSPLRRTRREQVLAIARAAAAFAEPERRRIVKELMKDRWRISRKELGKDRKKSRGRIPGSGYGLTNDHMGVDTIDATEAEIFHNAYDDESGAGYWQAFLFEPGTKSELVDLLAAHRAVVAVDFERLTKQLFAALVSAPEMCGRAEVEWLTENPNTTALLPASLRRWLRRESSPKQKCGRLGRESSNKQKPNQEDLDQVLLTFATERNKKIKQSDSEGRALLEGRGATTRQIQKAFRALPEKYRLTRGSRLDQALK